MKSPSKKKGHRAGFIVVFAIAAFLGPARGYAKAEVVEGKSECISCHTDVKNLVRLSSEIEKIRPEPGKSAAEAAGEG